VRVAVPSFEGRVSSVFDWAQRLLVVDHDGKTEQARREESLAGPATEFRPGRLARLGVEVLLCGGISVPLATMVQSQGIRVMAGLAGEVDAVLAAFFAGRLPAPEFAMPGWSFIPPPLGRGMGRRRMRRRGPGGGGRGRGR
jgi:predicted Fe-Mo cluster-binding NifX family protein